MPTGELRIAPATAPRIVGVPSCQITAQKSSIGHVVEPMTTPTTSPTLLTPYAPDDVPPGTLGRTVTENIGVCAEAAADDNAAVAAKRNDNCRLDVMCFIVSLP